MSTLKTIVNGPGHSQTLPPATMSYMEDPHGIVYVGDHSGHLEIWFYWFDEKEHDQLTRIDMKAAGEPGWEREADFEAFFPYSITVDHKHAWFYYIAHRELRRVNLSSLDSPIIDLPEGMLCWGFPSMSPDTRQIAIPLIDQDALFIPEAQLPRDRIEQRMHYADLKSQIMVIDCVEQVVLRKIDIPHAFVDRLQFHPEDENLILYHKQYYAADGNRRLWLYDGNDHINLRPVSDAESVHEHIHSASWTPTGDWIIYSGYHIERDRAFLGRVDPQGNNRKEIDLPANADQGELAIISHDLLVSSGHITDQPDEPFEVFNPQEPDVTIKDATIRHWISRFEVDWEAGEVEIDPLAPTDYDGGNVTAPPHAIPDPMGFFVYFTTYQDGYRSIRRANLESPDDDAGLLLG